MPQEKSLQHLIATQKERLDELYARERQLQEEKKFLLYQEAREIVNNPLNWEFQVKPDMTFTGELLPGRIRVERRLKTEVGERCYQPHDKITLRLPVDGRHIYWTGGRYYRTEEDILTSSYTVLPVLREPMLCNGVEWARILRNDIPEKFLLYPTMK